MEIKNYAEASEIKGKKVKDTLGHDYGKVRDILFSPGHRKAVLVVISTSGLFRNDYTVLPFQALRVNPNTQDVMVEIDKQTIMDAPQVDLDLLREGRREELEKVFSYYGYERFWQEDTNEAQPLHKWYKSGENSGERHPENEGSYQITKDYPGPGDSNIQEEADYDKIKGLPKDKK